MNLKLKSIAIVAMLFSLYACKDDDVNSEESTSVDLPCSIVEIVYPGEDYTEKAIFELNGDKITKFTSEYTGTTFKDETILTFQYNNEGLSGMTFKYYEDGVVEDEDEEYEITMESSNNVLNKINVKGSWYSDDSQAYVTEILQIIYMYENGVISSVKGYEGYADGKDIDASQIELTLSSEDNFTFNADGNLLSAESFYYYDDSGLRKLHLTENGKGFLNSFFKHKSQERSNLKTNTDETESSTFEYDDQLNPFSGLTYSNRVLLSSIGIMYYIGNGQLLSKNNVVKQNTFNQINSPDPDNNYSFSRESEFSMTYNEFDMPEKSEITITSKYTSGDYSDTSVYNENIDYVYKCD